MLSRPDMIAVSTGELGATHETDEGREREDGEVRRLVIARHAKSDWGDASLADHDRPLAPRGVGALSLMREHLAGGPPLDVVLCSSARRTVDTLEGIRAELPDTADVHIDDALYGASASMLLERLRSIGDDVAGVLLVGHNPGVHGLARGLVGDGGTELRARLASGFPTGAIATLSFDHSWADLDPGCARLVDFFTPRHAS